MSGISGSVEQMTQGHLRNVQQLAVFYTGHNNIYAINIAKVKAFIITEEVAINDTPKDTDVIAGIATIRGEPVTLVNLDAWLGLTALAVKDYKLIIFCEFNHKKIGFLVKDMLDIVEKTTQELRHTEETNSKITYTTYVKVNNKDELCTVFNAEQLLRDIHWTDDGSDQLKKYVEEKEEPAPEPIREERVADVKGGYAMTREEKKLSDNFANNKGRLPYPVTGRHTIVGTFGEQQHQDLKYVRTNNSGIDIQTSPGADARAVFNGEVTRVFVVPGYNNSVIIRHGNYLTVYSNLSQVYVKAGDRVSTRQSIGKIFTDSEDGNATILHFQLWKEKTKLNPAPWLD